MEQKIEAALGRLGIAKSEIDAIGNGEKRKTKVAKIIQRLSPRERMPLPTRRPASDTKVPECIPGDRRSMCSQPQAKPLPPSPPTPSPATGQLARGRHTRGGWLGKGGRGWGGRVALSCISN